MKTIIILLTISAIANTGYSNGLDPMLTDGLLLGEALDVPTNSISQVWTNPVFSTSGIIITNSFVIESKESIFDNAVEFNVSQANVVIATGILFECDSFDAARSALLHKMVMNNMLWNSIVPYCIVQTNTIGDFCITDKVLGTTNEAVANPSSIDFVRGAKAIRLYRNDNVDIQPIAETLDGLLVNPPSQAQ